MDERYFDDEQGKRFYLGNIEPPLGLMKAWPLYGTTPEVPMIPEPEWRGLIDGMNGSSPDYLYLPDDVKNQGPISMCNASATGDAVETQRKKQGLPPVTLSAADLYHFICYNGADNGSLLEDGLARVMDPDGGIAAASVVPYHDWRGQYGQAAKDSRRLYRVLQAYLCPTFAHCMSASIMGFSIITGVVWYRQYVPGADGWLKAGSTKVGGHAMHGYKPAYRVVQGRLEYGIWHRQSWGPDFGPFRARFVLPQRAYGGPVGGCWAVRGVTDEGGVVPPLVA